MGGCFSAEYGVGPTLSWLSSMQAEILLLCVSPVEFIDEMGTGKIQVTLTHDKVLRVLWLRYALKERKFVS